MRSKEINIHPTGRFPSVAVEKQFRGKFISSRNPLFLSLQHSLKELGVIKKQSEISQNLVSFYYGVYFYNSISRFSLFPPESDVPIDLLADKEQPFFMYTDESGLIHVNLKSYQSKLDLNIKPTKQTTICDGLFINLPIYICRIVDGLEEAAHLHLEVIYQRHEPNLCNRTDHQYPNRLWKDSGDNAVAYRAKLWHEFAALTVQKAYLDNYVIHEYPEAVAEFNDFYSDVKEERRRWIRRRR